MSSISLKIDGGVRNTLRVEEVDINTFENVLIAEFRLIHQLSSFDLYFLADDTDGGMIFSTTRKHLVGLRTFLNKNKGFSLRGDLDGGTFKRASL